MTTSIDDLRQRLVANLADGIEVRTVSATDRRIGCVTPLQYPDGDHVVVWVRPRVDGEFEVTDYGDALADSVSGKTKERAGLEEFAGLVAAGLGVRFVSGRLFAECDWNDLAGCVWNVAVAAAQLGQAAAAQRPRGGTREKESEDEFVSTVADGLHAVGVAVERERGFDGRSGHRHRATFYLPQSESVIEPVAGHWNQVTAVFTRLADLGDANGYRLFSVLDDRQDAIGEDVPGLLVQVSRVIRWSRRDEWLPSVAGGSLPPG